MTKAVVLIPARYGSSRFPGKPLATIAGKSMIQRVYTNCLESGFECAVVTDHSGIEEHVKEFGGHVIRVDDDVPSGSERIALAYQRFYERSAPEIVINVQGDEPLLRGEVLKELANFHLNSSYDMTTLIRSRQSNEQDFINPNVVKAVWSEVSGQCLYFSRQSVPYDREGDKVFNWFQHIGVYSYRPQALLKFVKLSMSKLEDLEKLEQLRAMENGFSIGAIKTTQKLIGVDVPDDIKKVEGALGE
jgi:3-deoxy-manno-octulosonate cytidylyltransferase (CMP-KDO synthetase)